MKGPPEVYYSPGGDIQLVCGTNVSGNPQQDITVLWKTEHQTIIPSSDSRFSSIHDGNGIRLSITQATLEDAGYYSCKISSYSHDVTLPDGSIQNLLVSSQSVIIRLIPNSKLTTIVVKITHKWFNFIRAILSKSHPQHSK